MRKDQAIFFLSGLVFGVLLGYFVFRSVSEERPGVGFSGAGALARSPAVDSRELADLQREAESRPDDDEVRVRLASHYLSSGQPGVAIRWLEDALAIDPDNPHAHSHLGEALGDVGRVDQAISEYEKALQLDPGHARSLMGLGRLKLYSQKDIRGGLEVWDQLMRLAPDSPEARSIREELESLRSAHSGS